MASGDQIIETKKGSGNECKTNEIQICFLNQESRSTEHKEKFRTWNEKKKILNVFFGSGDEINETQTSSGN